MHHVSWGQAGNSVDNSNCLCAGRRLGLGGGGRSREYREDHVTFLNRVGRTISY